MNKKTCNINDCFSVLDCVEHLLLQHFADGNHKLVLPGIAEIAPIAVSQTIRNDIKEVIEDFRQCIKNSGAR